MVGGFLWIAIIRDQAHFVPVGYAASTSVTDWGTIAYVVFRAACPPNVPVSALAASRWILPRIFCLPRAFWTRWQVARQQVASPQARRQTNIRDTPRAREVHTYSLLNPEAVHKSQRCLCALRPRQNTCASWPAPRPHQPSLCTDRTPCCYFSASRTGTVLYVS